MEQYNYPKAKALLDKYLEGKCTPEEISLLEHWYQDIDDTATSLSDEEVAAYRRRFMTNVYSIKRAKRPLRLPAFWRAAAMWIGVITLAAAGYHYTARFFSAGPQAAYITIRTGIREVKRVTLPDSSIVWLNANTSLVYNEDFAHNRNISMNGEALFNVRPDPSHPFTVQTQDSINTLVLGTSFNVSSYGGRTETRVAVLSGKVEVADKVNVLGRLSANEAIHYDRQQNRFYRITSSAANAAGWIKGQWTLNDQGVAALAALLYNQFGITVRYDAPSPEALKINANFNAGQSADEIIHTFCLLAGRKFKWVDKTTVQIF